MPFVRRDNDGNIVGVVGRPNPKYPEYIEGEVTTYATTALENAEARDDALTALTHDFGDGRIMQTRPKDEQNIRNAIEVMEAHDIPTIGWRMSDNTISAISAAELRVGLAAGQLAALGVWGTYNA